MAGDDVAAAKKADKVQPAEVPKLGRASESGDAGVHILLAQRSIHASNGDADKVAEVDRQLADLGLTAQ